MNEDYLWDRTGTPDEEIAQLEQVLGRLRYKPSRPRLGRGWMLAAAAVVLVSIGVAIALRSGEVTNWQLTVGGKQATQVRRGQIIETDGKTTATLEAQDVGEVHVEPDSKLRLTRAGKSAQQFRLERGVIHAFIWAPPTQFVVDTPAAKTIDLGCQYTLTVAPDGSGELTVTMGWVAFQEGNWNRSFRLGRSAECGQGTDRGHRIEMTPPRCLLTRFNGLITAQMRRRWMWWCKRRGRRMV